MHQTLRLTASRIVFLLCALASLREVSVLADEKLAGRACRSVHWQYEAPAAVAFYNEVTIDRTAPGTYFCGCGFNRGYYGLQELADGKHLLIFSIWDPGKQNDPNAVAEEQRVKLLHQGEGVRVGRFGNEGTGGQSFFDYDWKVGATYRLLVIARPSTSLETQGHWTEVSGYFFVPETSKWKHLVTFATRTDVATLGGYYSFVEDFRRNGESLKQLREARFGNGWVHTADGKWQAIAKARFTADSNPATNINAALRGEEFLLSTGGDATNTEVKLLEWADATTTAAEREPPRDLPALKPEGIDTPRPTSQPR